MLTRHRSNLPRAVALALGLGGYPGPDITFAIETLDELLLNSDRRFNPIVPAQDEWWESPRHFGTIQLSGIFGIDLQVFYEDSRGRKGTVKSFHRLDILRDRFEITSDGQTTKFPLNGRMTKRFTRGPRTIVMDCFTMSTSFQIALECTIATKDRDCIGNFVWKFVVQFSPAGDCINVTTVQRGGHDCGGEKDQAGFRSTAFNCSRLGL